MDQRGLGYKRGRRSFGSSEDLNERVAEVLMKEHNGKDHDFVKQKLDEIKPQIDFVVSLFNYINPCPLEDQPITGFYC